MKLMNNNNTFNQLDDLKFQNKFVVQFSPNLVQQEYISDTDRIMKRE
jgi:hypothetical protein